MNSLPADKIIFSSPKPPASLGTGGVHPVSKLRMSGTLPTVRPTISWCAQGQYTLTFFNIILHLRNIKGFFLKVFDLKFISPYFFRRTPLFLTLLPANLLQLITPVLSKSKRYEKAGPSSRAV